MKHLQYSVLKAEFLSGSITFYGEFHGGFGFFESLLLKVAISVLTINTSFSQVFPYIEWGLRWASRSMVCYAGSNIPNKPKRNNI